METPRSTAMRSRHQGFSLVEIMVALVIGLISILVMTRMTEAWESRKRSGASAGDAQVAGSIGLYRLEQDLRLAGYGFGASTALGCAVIAYDATRAIPDFSFPLLPVEIEDGASGMPDTLNVLYGNADLTVTTYPFAASTTSSKTPPISGSREGIRKGELVIVQNLAPAGCGLIEITDNANADGLTVNHATGDYTDSGGGARTARFNAAGGLGVTFTGGRMYNMGPGPRRNIWQINNGSLTVRNDLINGDVTEVAEGIVNLQAQYGLDTTGDGIIDIWQSDSPGAWNQVRAVRVVLLARGQQYEKTAVTPNAPVTGWVDAFANPILFAMRNLDGASGTPPTNDPQDWRHYRYRVYSTVIPLRNMIWGSSL